MGKKDGNKQRKDDHPVIKPYDVEEDDELQAELEAVAAMRAEKARAGGDTELTEFTTYNKEGLLRHVDMSESVVLPFIETLVVDGFGVAVDNENEDLEREMSFYNQSILAVKLGREKLEQLGVPTRRPTDYFCENMKSDGHMTKIKDRLLLEEKRIEAFEMRKNREQNRKFNKQVSDLKKQEKSKKTKSEISEVAKLRKSNDSSDAKEERLNKVLNGDHPEKSKKRKIMDKKYGFGGKERKFAKINDKKSLNDMKDFNPRGGKFIRRTGAAGPGGRGGAAAGRSATAGGKGGKRPGKDARANKRKATGGR